MNWKQITSCMFTMSYKFEFIGFSLSSEEVDYSKDLSYSSSSHFNQSDDEEAHDEEDYYFAMVKTLTQNDISSSKLVSICQQLSVV